ncbi:hypothetical protein ACQEVZ_53700 [Dactylosporangium sp. CA-152071]
MYALTDAGTARLDAWRRQWRRFVDIVDATLTDQDTSRASGDASTDTPRS